MGEKRKKWKNQQQGRIKKDWTSRSQIYNSAIGNALINIKRDNPQIKKFDRFDPNQIEVFFDGSFCKDLVESAGIGVSIYQRGVEIYNLKEVVSLPTGSDSSIAEYLAFIYAIEAAREITNTYNCTIYGDSKLVINQMTGRWVINSARPYTEFAKLAQQKLKGLFEVMYIRILWLPRKKNKRADDLSRD